MLSFDDQLRNFQGRQPRWFSRIVLRAAMQYIPLAAHDQDSTAFTIPGKGQWKWLRANAGMVGGAATLGHILSEVILGLDGCLTAANEILCCSTDKTGHL